jgi:phosphoglycerate dehydrogenase-like enzyme
LQQLPNLKLIASTGPRNASIETQTAADLGIAVTATGYDSTPTIEFTWSLILASMRGIDREAVSLRGGGWQTGLGSNLRGKSLGVVGLGNIGREVARIGLAFGTKVIAWSQNLTEEKAGAAGAILVDKQTLFREADIVTVHLVLSSRTKGLIGAPEFALMKPTARLVNTSRAPIVDEAALIEALQARRIAGAAIDVFDIEPLQTDHPFRKLERPRHASHRLCHRGSLSNFLRRRGGEHCTVAGEQRADIVVMGETVEQRGTWHFSIPNWNKSYLLKRATWISPQESYLDCRNE